MQRETVDLIEISVPPNTIFAEYFCRIFGRILFGANLSIRHLTEYSVNVPNIRFLPNIRVLPNIRTILGQGESVTVCRVSL